MALIFEGIGAIDAARSLTWVTLKPAEAKTAFKASWSACAHSVGAVAQRDWCPRCIMTPVWVVRGPVPLNCTRLRKNVALFGKTARVLSNRFMSFTTITSALPLGMAASTTLAQPVAAASVAHTWNVDGVGIVRGAV